MHNKRNLKMSSAKRSLFCHGFSVLTLWGSVITYVIEFKKMNQCYGVAWRNFRAFSLPRLFFTYTQHNVLFHTLCRVTIWLLLWWFDLFGAGTFTTNKLTRDRKVSQTVAIGSQNFKSPVIKCRELLVHVCDSKFLLCIWSIRIS